MVLWVSFEWFFEWIIGGFLWVYIYFTFGQVVHIYLLIKLLVMRWGWVKCFKELMGWRGVWVFEKKTSVVTCNCIPDKKMTNTQL
jgi:hypothetical protein